MEKQKLIVICGPTASGKTALAVSLAQKCAGEIISADSMQVYRGMDIGTAKPTETERGGVPHHLLDCVDPGEDFGAAMFQRMARACIDDITSRGKIPILCGGTGLYINATVYPLTFDNADPDDSYRRELLEYAAKNGNEALHALLAKADPESAASIHPNNVRRVIRALERARMGNNESASNQLFNGDLLYEMAWVGFAMDRAELYRRIDERVDKMMESGLLEEVKSLAGEFGIGSTALQALGYKELLWYLNGRIPLNEAIDQIKTGSRNYAKRQLTWFRRESTIQWFDVLRYHSKDALLDDISGYIRSSLHMS